MAIRFKAELVGGFGPRHFAGDSRRHLASAVRAGVGAATIGLKTQIRDQIQGVGLGVPLSNAIGSKLFPAKGKETLHPAGSVFPRGKLAYAIFDALNQGAPIRARNSRYLAVPTRNAWIGGRGGHRPTPEEFARRTGVDLFVVEAHKRRNVLLLMGRRYRGRVKGGAKESLVYFILVPVVRPGPRLTFDLFARRWADRIPDLIDRATPGFE